jgi:hypothetical protein
MPCSGNAAACWKEKSPGSGMRLSARTRLATLRPSRGRWANVFQTYVEIVQDALRTLEKGGGLTVPGALNKFTVFAQRLIPSRLIPGLVAKMSRV